MGKGLRPIATLPRISKLSKKSIPAETALATQPIAEDSPITQRSALKKRGVGNLRKI
jgi:hypothetical protein